MIIDAHHHYPKSSVCPYTETYAEALEEIADEYGVRYYCVLGLPDRPSHFGNSEVMKLTQRCDKVLAFPRVDVDDGRPDDVHAFDQEGCAGFKIIMTRRAYQAKEYFPFYEAMAATGKPVMFHTGMQGRDPGEIVDSSLYQPVYLDAIAARFPDWPIICGHMGVAWYQDALALPWYNDNIYLDLSASAVTRGAPWFHAHVVEGGYFDVKWDHLVFGTDSMVRDFSFTFDHCQAVFAYEKIDQATIDAIMGGNMARLLHV